MPSFGHMKWVSYALCYRVSEIISNGIKCFERSYIIPKEVKFKIISLRGNIPSQFTRSPRSLY